LLLVFLSAMILIYRAGLRYLATALPFLAIISDSLGRYGSSAYKKAGIWHCFLGFGIIIWWGFNAVNIPFIATSARIVLMGIQFH
jgi:hypothetical protein